MNNSDLLWKQYQLNIDLYKGYLELALRINIFYYAITGAIISYYLKTPDVTQLKFSLVLPLLMSVAFGVFFIIGAILARVPRIETFRIRDKLGLMAAPEIGVLIILLYIFAALMFLVAVGLLWLLLDGPVVVNSTK